MKKFIVIALLSLMPTISMAVDVSQINHTKITKLMMDVSYGQMLFIDVEGTPDRPEGGCHNNAGWDFAISIADDFGKQMHSQLLTAYTAKTQVYMQGSGLCIVNNNIEGLKRLEMQ